MARLPQPGSDSGTWGNILNEFLTQSHNGDGTLKSGSVGASQLQPGSVTKASIGLGNVDNTSDANKPVSTAQQTALDLKLNTAQLNADTTLGGGGALDTLVASQKAVKTYVDNSLAPLAPATKRAAYTGSRASADSSAVIGDSNPGAHFRQMLRLPFTTTRWRLRFSNHRFDGSGNEVTHTGTCTFTGLWMGDATISANGWTGAYTAAPTQALPGWVVTNSTEYVSPWVTAANLQFEADRDHQVSFGYTASSGTLVAQGMSSCYFSLNQADASAVGAGLAFSDLSLFDWYIEYEAAVDAPTILFIGDSLTQGFRNGAPGRGGMSGFPTQHSVRAQTLATNLGITSSATAHWLDATKPILSPWSAANGWSWDAVVISVGSNDVFAGATDAAVKANLTTIVNSVRSVLQPKRIYLCTILPRPALSGNPSFGQMNTYRVSINQWMEEQHDNITGAIRMDKAIASPTDANAFDAGMDAGDGHHVNYGGYGRMAHELGYRL